MEKKLWAWWIFFLVIAAGCYWINVHYFRIQNIIPLEFSRNELSMRTYIQAIDPNPIRCYDILKNNTLVDYGFIIGYSGLAFFSLRIILGVFQLQIKNWLVLLFSCIAGLLDCIENYYLLTTATDHKEKFDEFFCLVVRVKWGFSLFVILAIPIVIIYGLVLLFRFRKK